MLHCCSSVKVGGFGHTSSTPRHTSSSFSRLLVALCCLLMAPRHTWSPLRCNSSSPLHHSSHCVAFYSSLVTVRRLFVANRCNSSPPLHHSSPFIQASSLFVASYSSLVTLDRLLVGVSLAFYCSGLYRSGTWVYQAGAAVAVKSYNKERLKQNVQVFDWELSDEDLDKIN